MMSEPVHQETMLHRETVFDGKVIHVTLDEVRLENGKTAMREIVRHHGGACVAALTAEGALCFVRQFRYAYEKELLELPAGKLEKGEDPFLAAKRELEEEMGVTAEEYADLGIFYPTCGYCNEIIHLYAAKGLHRTEQHLDPDEFVTTLTIPFEEAQQMALDGRINDGKTIAAIFRLRALREAGRF